MSKCFWNPKKLNANCHGQAWCEAAVGDLPYGTDTDVDTELAGDWLAETSESQSHAGHLPMRQLSSFSLRAPNVQGLDTVEEASSEGTPHTAAPARVIVGIYATSSPIGKASAHF